ncbi:hypothetical protein Pfo_004369 [Paulownia fortunei]|nr:hypothetical protein Pfo_004369 [Paulownia fortunei]
MEGSTGSPAGINRVLDTSNIAYLNKKRKLQDELLEMPLPKHICWGQSLECDSSPGSSTKPKKVENDKFARGGESDPESAKDSNSFHCNADSIMSTDDEAKTDLGYPEICASDEPSTSSASWAGTSSEIGLYSSECRSLTTSSSSEPESLSISEQLDCPHYQYGLHPPLNYEGHLGEFGSHADCSCSEYRNDGMEQCTDKELENLLYSNGVAPSNFVLSSGRWSVNQEAQQEGKKQTIDKEFEQYFSMLML